MDNEEISETGFERHSEPIEISVVPLDAEMIIIQPVEVNQVDNDSASIDQPITTEENQTVDLSSEADVTPSRKKRKRSPKKPPPPLHDDDDDGATCSICLDSWEARGEHRLVSLKCGHLFGDSCIKRWIHECPSQSKCCPTCKSKALPRDLRPLFAKRVVVVDKSEEYRLQDLLDVEKKKNVDLQSQLSTIKLEMAIYKEEYAKLETECNRLRQCGVIYDAPSTSTQRQTIYKMSMHKNIEINRDGGCRAITYGRRIQTLIMSQKSSIALFPGYGVRFVSAYNLQPTIYFRMSLNAIRDLSLDSNEELLAAVGNDKSAYIYSVTNNTPVATMAPSQSHIWTSSFDKVRQNNIHLGTQQGITFTYDMRNYSSYVEQLTTPGDGTPVIGIQSVPVSNQFPFGGFIVCKLRSLCFYEYTASARTQQTPLPVEGSFASINFNEQTNVLLIATRISAKFPQARLIVSNLTKIDGTPVLLPVCTILGTRIQQTMTRSTQITIGNDSLIASYLQDLKCVTTWNADNGNRMQGFNVDDCILDMCPMYINDTSFLATLSDTRCRIFQLNSI